MAVATGGRCGQARAHHGSREAGKGRTMTGSTSAWNEIFRQQGRVFTEHHEDLPGLALRLKSEGATRILDLGCGTGRHTVFLAAQGFSVAGLDNSPEAIEATQCWLEEQGLTADLHLGSMAERLPFEDGCFDAVISIQVIHHARLNTIRALVQELTRVLREGALLFVTVPRLRNQAQAFEEIEPHTFVPLDGPEDGLPHHIFAPEELQEVFDAFEIEDIHVDAVDHYCLTAIKPRRGGTHGVALPSSGEEGLRWFVA
jgi:SAM-dependent methyltransferase